MLVTPEKLEEFMRKEQKQLLNENDEVEKERDMVTAERETTELN